MREDRALLELEGPPAVVAFHHEVGAEDVRRHQVGRELDAAEAQLQHLAERADEQRLAEPGHAFEQHVAAAQDGRERAVHDGVLSDHDFADLGTDGGVDLAETVDGFFGGHGGEVSGNGA